MDELCPRCGATLQPVDDAPPAFCGRCGLPQLRLSEDALPASLNTGAPPHLRSEIGAEPGAAHRIDWPLALRVLAAAALLGVVPPACLPGALTAGTISGLAVLLMPALTLCAIVVYHRSRPRRAISATTGVRMGAVLGLFMGSLIAFVTGIAGFIMRYGYHSHTMDDGIRQATDTMIARLSASQPVPPDLVAFFHSPEFHAGTFLLGHAMSLLLLVAVGSVCGWIAGAMLRTRWQRGLG